MTGAVSLKGARSAFRYPPRIFTPGRVRAYQNPFVAAIDPNATQIATLPLFNASLFGNKAVSFLPPRVVESRVESSATLSSQAESHLGEEIDIAHSCVTVRMERIYVAILVVKDASLCQRSW